MNTDQSPSIAPISPAAEAGWLEPRERADGEVAEKVEGTILVHGQDTLSVNLMPLLRGYVIGWCVWPFVLAFALTMQYLSIELVIYLIISQALFSIQHEFQRGRCHYIFDRASRCLITGANRRYGFENYDAVVIRWLWYGFVVDLAMADHAQRGRLQNLRRWVATPRRVGNFRLKSNARLVANAVAEFMGLKVEGG